MYVEEELIRLPSTGAYRCPPSDDVAAVSWPAACAQVEAGSRMLRCVIVARFFLSQCVAVP